MKNEQVSAIHPAPSHYEHPITASDLLNESEVAHMLGVATGTTRNWRSLRIGPVYVKIGKRAVRYRRADVDAFIASGMVDTGAAA